MSIVKKTLSPPCWQQQKDESEQAFEAFKLYLAFGDDRSIKRVAHELKKSNTIISRWSVVWRWSERIREFNNYQFAEEEKRIKKDIRGKYE
jgi:hypothetical protein